MVNESLLNVQKEKEIVKQLISLVDVYENSNQGEQSLMKTAINSLISELKLISDATSELIQAEDKPIKREYQRVETSSGIVFVNKKNKEDFMKQVGLENEIFKKIRTTKKTKEEEIKKPSFFVSLSSKIFHNLSSKASESSLFSEVGENLKKANMSLMASSYLSLTFFITLIVLIISLAFALGLSSSTVIIRNVVIAILVSVFAFIFTVNYPAINSSSVKNRLEDELPFAVSHMSAIASSKVEPSKIFPIMARVNDYPYFAREAKKIVNQMNIYGYDLVTALKNAAKNSSNEQLAELFTGIATTTVTGGELNRYLQEKSKDLLMDYRLRRQKYGEVVGMLSDIYTALLIAAPLILMLILAIMSVIGSSFIGLSIPSLATLGLVVIVILNLIFLVVISVTQPKK